MAKVRFMGTEDVRVLTWADINNHVAISEGLATNEFYKGQDVEVSEEVAYALVNHPHLFGRFDRVEGSETLDLPEADLPSEDTLPVKKSTAKR